MGSPGIIKVLNASDYGIINQYLCIWAKGNHFF
jgi:hypothetical protein